MVPQLVAEAWAGTSQGGFFQRQRRFEVKDDLGVQVLGGLDEGVDDGPGRVGHGELDVIKIHLEINFFPELVVEVIENLHIV